MSDPAEEAKYRELKRLLSNLERFVPDNDPEGNPVQQRQVLGRPGEELASLSLTGPRFDRGQIEPRRPDPDDDAAHSDDVPPLRDNRGALVPTGVRGTIEIRPATFIVATVANAAISAVLAVLITLGVTRQEPARVETSVAPAPPVRVETAAAPTPATVPPARATASTIEPAQPPAGGAATIVGSLAPVGAAPTLGVAAPAPPMSVWLSLPATISLPAGSPGPLPLRLEPPSLRGSFLLVIAGLPSGATLAGATQIGSDTWLVLADPAPRLQLALPDTAADQTDLAIELRRLDGSSAARATTRVVLVRPVTPVPAAPAIASTPPADEAGAVKLLQRGELFLDSGDLGAARYMFERAAEQGSARAALALGATYDPQRIWQLGILGMVANKERARQWYQRAEQLGSAEAKQRLRELAAN